MIDEKVCGVCQELLDFSDIVNFRPREIRASGKHPRLKSAPLKCLVHPHHVIAHGIAHREMRSHNADATDGRLRRELIICSRHQMNLSWNIQSISRSTLPTDQREIARAVEPTVERLSAFAPITERTAADRVEVFNAN